MATGRGREATATNSQLMSSIYSKIWIHFLVTNMALVAPKFRLLRRSDILALCSSLVETCNEVQPAFENPGQRRRIQAQ